jgi:hypothetical protein
MFEHSAFFPFLCRHQECQFVELCLYVDLEMFLTQNRMFSHFKQLNSGRMTLEVWKRNDHVEIDDIAGIYTAHH